MTFVLIGMTLTIFLVHTTLRYLNSLQMFQQNLYDTKRYLTWFAEHSDKSLPLLDIFPLILWLAIFFYPSKQLAHVLLFLTTFFYLLESIVLYRKRKRFVKKPLVITARVWRLIITSIVLFVIIFCGVSVAFLYNPAYQAIGLIFGYILLNLFIYLFVWLANLINSPIEKAIQKKYMDEAKDKIAGMRNHLTVVGITGSYGKTTTKNIVNHVLNESFYALMTPASYNTPMGITISIRELLKPIHDIFVVEMGAYKVGEIKALTEIAQPNYGILTSIGPQHLNTFKTIENVQQTKFELIETLGKDGVAILNYDDPLIRSYKMKNNCKIITYGIDYADAHYRATNIELDEQGIQFTVVFPDQQKASFALPLLGEHNILNALAAIAVATNLGEPIEKIKQGLATLPQIEHRLELKPAGSFTIIDDAFNANPVGTKKAIDVLTKMPGKRIVITPGMIELGKEEERLNYEYGAYMADKIDVAILVGIKKTKPILRGLETKMATEHIFVVKNLSDALDKMRQEAIPGSFVLIANDLPDSYNE